MKTQLRTILSTVALAAVIAAPAGAATIINTFNSDLNTANAFIQLSDAAANSSGLYPSGGAGWKNVSAFQSNKSAPANFTGPAPFQVGAYANFVGATALGTFNTFVGSRNVSSSSQLEMTFGSVTAATGATSTNVGALFLVNKSSFLNGLNLASNVSFSATDLLSINVARFDAGVATNGAIRFVIQDGTNYYVSQTNRTTTGTFSLSNPNAALWAAYDPATNMNFNSGATFAAHTFSNVLAVGVLYDNDNYTGTGASTLMRMTNFEVTAIPEPSGIALALFGAGALALARRRRS
jgi:hypothetical protein